MNIIHKKVSDLVPYFNNPRRNEESVDFLVNSIKQFGFKVPILIDTKNVIISGHTRLKAAEKIGMETVPCIVDKELSEEQIAAFRIVDNKVAEHSEWDMKKLSQEMDLKLFDFTQYGFLDLELDLIKDDQNIDFKPTLQPQFSDNEITNEEIEKRALELANKMIKEQQIIKVQCPYCDEQFEIEN
jgi:ParB-like chromosome segregation protein Spo0J